MHEQDLTILKGLVSVAWADGRVTSQESEIIEGLLAGYRASPSEAHEVRLYAREPKTLDDVMVSDLSLDDRRVLLQHAVLVTWSDGELHEKERELLLELARRLRIPPLEVEVLLHAAEERAKQLLQALEGSR